jgi:hypothetical protein
VTPASAARRSALLLAVVAVALVALTPVGVWIAATVGGWFAEGAGWRLEAAHHGGSLATTARWRDLRLANDGLGLQVEASQLSLSPWSWAVDLHEPQITWDLPADTSAVSTEEAGGDTLRLPVADLPQIVVTGASLRLQAADSLAVTIDDADLQLQASASGEAAARERQVTWSVASWSLAAGSTRIDGETSGQARLRSTDVSLRDLFLRVASGEARGTLRGRADLSLAPTLDVETELTLEGQTAQAAGLWADVLAAGALRPLDLGLTINGGGEVDGIGPVETHVVARIDTTGGSADSLSLHVAGGHAGGRLSWRSADGWIEAAAELKELALTTLTGGALSGPLSGRVEWRGAVEAPEATVDVRSAAIGGLSAEPIDLDLSARLQGSDLTARARSDRLGQLEAAGSLRLTEPSADLRLSGRLDAAPWLGHSWPLSTRGTLRSGADAERLSVRLTAGALPFGESPPGPVMADVELTDWRHLQVKVGVDRGQLAGWARLDLATTTLDTLRLGADAVGLAGLSGALRGNLTGQVAGGADDGAVVAGGRPGVGRVERRPGPAERVDRQRPRRRRCRRRGARPAGAAGHVGSPAGNGRAGRSDAAQSLLPGRAERARTGRGAGAGARLGARRGAPRQRPRRPRRLDRGVVGRAGRRLRPRAGDAVSGSLRESLRPGAHAGLAVA